MNEAIRTAFTLYQTGDLTAATAQAFDILAQTPKHAEASVLLGLIFYQQGEIERAAHHLAHAVKCEPHNVQALYNYGLVLLQQKRAPEAHTVLQRLSELQPDLPEAQFLLGNTLVELHQQETAAVCFQKAVALNPLYYDAWFNLGVVSESLRRYPEAIMALQHVLASIPDHTLTLFHLGLIYHAQGLNSLAIEAYRSITRITQDDPSSCSNLGILLRDEGYADEAIYWLNRACILQPSDPCTFNNLGLAFHEARQFDKAIASFRKAIDLRPDYAEAFSNIGRIMLDTGQFDEAIIHCQQAATLSPQLHEAWYNLGKCYGEIGDTTRSIAMYRNALAIKPDLAEAHWNMSHALLLTGLYEEGFQEYLWRWRRKSAAMPDIPKPEWRGEQIPNQTLLIHAEQGMGDAIQFARYLPLAKERVGKIYLTCDPSLNQLFQSLNGVDAILNNTKLDTLFHAIDYHVPLLNLPTLFKTTEKTIPARTPYLHPDRKNIKRYAPLFTGNETVINVGIAWKGNPEHKNDANRSCRLADFEPLFALPGVNFFSLQKHRCAEDGAFHGVDLAPHLQTFADTAALTTLLDLIITVDTSIAHLAGALGQRVWVLLPLVPDWRWGTSGNNTPWYPTMTLFRQQQRGDWHSPFVEVRDALETAKLAKRSERSSHT